VNKDLFDLGGGEEEKTFNLHAEETRNSGRGTIDASSEKKLGRGVYRKIWRKKDLVPRRGLPIKLGSAK